MSTSTFLSFFKIRFVEEMEKVNLINGLWMVDEKEEAMERERFKKL